MNFVLILSLFISVLIYAAALLFLASKNRQKIKLRDRIDKLASDDTQQQKTKQVKRRVSLSSALAALFKPGTLSNITLQLSVAGINLKAEEYLLIWMSTGIVIPALCCLLSKNIIVALGFAIFGLIIPPLIVARYKKKRMSLFETQLLDALIVICNCLRAGFTFQQAIGNIASEMPEPISKEFSKVIREIRLGVPMDDALQNMVKRLQNDDLELLVQAVLIQKQVGGNLADILDSIAGTINERLKLKGEIKVLTASGKISGFIIGLLPVFLLAFLMITNPSYVSTFFTTTSGICMLIASAIMEFIGFMIIRKIVNIKF